MPWSSWDEWAEVKQLLTSPAAEDRSSGIQRVAAWRVRGRVPLAVESTASLAEAMMLDDQQAACSSSGVAVGPALTEYSLRLRYALPLIKLVNGVADSQQRGRVASSVAVLSAVAGLPR